MEAKNLKPKPSVRKATNAKQARDMQLNNIKCNRNADETFAFL